MCLSKDFDNSAMVFGLLHDLLSNRNKNCDIKDRTVIREYIHCWFMQKLNNDLMEFPLKRFLNEKKIDPNDKNQWMVYLTVLTFLKKIVKYENVHHVEGESCLVDIVTDTFINHQSLSEGKMNRNSDIFQPLLLKLLKVLNQLFSLEVIIEKRLIATSLLNASFKITKLFHSMFKTLVQNNHLSSNRLFCGRECENEDNRGPEYQNLDYNYMTAAQYMILLLKSCLFMSQMDANGKYQYSFI